MSFFCSRILSRMYCCISLLSLLNFSVDCDSFSDFLVSEYLDTFKNCLARYFVEFSSAGIWPVLFSWLNWDNVFWEKEHRGKGSFSSHQGYILSPLLISVDMNNWSPGWGTACQLSPLWSYSSLSHFMKVNFLD